jgi:WD40 repeat-containing protein SMU1
MENIEVNASDAICLILQFLKENRLTNSLKTLQEEAQVSLNAVDSTEAFFSDILNGRWDIVLQQTNTLECNVNTMIALYEQIAIEMIETQENDVARQILHMSSPMKQLKLMNPPRYVPE